MLPCYQWVHCVIAPDGHPILGEKALSLAALARWPLITYDSAFAGRSRINKAFELARLTPNVVLTAIDADVIKTYVSLGLGLGIIARMAFDPHAMLACRRCPPSTSSARTRRASACGAAPTSVATNTISSSCSPRT
jgi:DNA-binding transcriptional LysR family regulator